MFNSIIHNIEYAYMQLPEGTLLGVGIACTFSGLVIWLAGLGLSRLAAGVIGGFTGCFVGYAFITSKFEFIALAVFIGVVTGLAIEILLSHSVGYANFGYNLTMAFLSAVSGAFLILLGITFLLLFKGTTPLTHAKANQKLYLTILFAMIVFGTFEQLIFCRKKTTRSEYKKKTLPATEIGPTKKSSWRNK